MDKCNYAIDGTCPCLRESQLCLCTAEISGAEFSLPKEKFRGEKNLQEFGKAFVTLEVLFSRMAPVSSAVQGRNWTHPRGSCPLPTLPQQCQGSLKAPSFPLSPCSCGLFPQPSPTRIPHGNQLQLQKGGRNPCPASRAPGKQLGSGSAHPAQTGLLSVCGSCCHRISPGCICPCQPPRAPGCAARSGSWCSQPWSCHGSPAVSPWGSKWWHLSRVEQGWEIPFF